MSFESRLPDSLDTNPGRVVRENIMHPAVKDASPIIHFKKAYTINNIITLNQTGFMKCPKDVLMKTWQPTKERNRSRFKKSISVQDQGGAELHPAGNLKDVEGMKREPNADM